MKQLSYLQRSVMFVVTTPPRCKLFDGKMIYFLAAVGAWSPPAECSARFKPLESMIFLLRRVCSSDLFSKLICVLFAAGPAPPPLIGF